MVDSQPASSDHGHGSQTEAASAPSSVHLNGDILLRVIELIDDSSPKTSTGITLSRQRYSTLILKHEDACDPVTNRTSRRALDVVAALIATLRANAALARHVRVLDLGTYGTWSNFLHGTVERHLSPAYQDVNDHPPVHDGPTSENEIADNLSMFRAVADELRPALLNMTSLIHLDLDALLIAQWANLELRTVLQEMKLDQLTMLSGSLYTASLLRQLNGTSTPSLCTIFLARPTVGPVLVRDDREFTQDEEIVQEREMYDDAAAALGRQVLRAGPVAAAIQLAQIRILHLPLEATSTNSFPGVETLVLYSPASALPYPPTVVAALLKLKELSVDRTCAKHLPHLLQAFAKTGGSVLRHLQLREHFERTNALETSVHWVKQLKVLSLSTIEDPAGALAPVTRAIEQGFGMSLVALNLAYAGPTIPPPSIGVRLTAVQIAHQTVSLVLSCLMRCPLPVLECFSLTTYLEVLKPDHALGAAVLESEFKEPGPLRTMKASHPHIRIVEWANNHSNSRNIPCRRWVYNAAGAEGSGCWTRSSTPPARQEHFGQPLSSASLRKESWWSL
ncbi:hypothetical protein BKA62DRAFT_831912 [Auriculariales sp. MPI-PUGE-AT-0066]|nr:hypothetical protein BKA62DRAFT_831912 [Auriculariales sp. MPI-PUGE-AT-0066]